MKIISDAELNVTEETLDRLLEKVPAWRANGIGLEHITACEAQLHEGKRLIAVCRQTDDDYLLELLSVGITGISSMAVYYTELAARQVEYLARLGTRIN